MRERRGMSNERRSAEYDRPSYGYGEEGGPMESDFPRDMERSREESFAGPMSRRFEGGRLDERGWRGREESGRGQYPREREDMMRGEFDYPERGYDRGERGFERGERGFDRGERGFGGFGDRGERGFERGERGFDRGERGFEHGKFAGRGPRSFRRSDERLYDEIGGRLTEDQWLDPSEIDIQVHDAVVMLKGTVNDRESKHRAEEIAESVTGVRDVRNELHVRGRGDGHDQGEHLTPGATANTGMGTTGARYATVFGAFRDMAAADRAINELKNAGFTREDISFVTKERGGENFPTNARGTTGAESKGATTGAVLGGLGGGALGWLLGVGALAIPGVGPIVAGGALATTIVGAAAGAVAGGLVGGLVGVGVPENEAREYERLVKEGAVLVSVNCMDENETDRAKDILHQIGAEKVKHFRTEHEREYAGQQTGRSGNGTTRETREREREPISR